MGTRGHGHQSIEKSQRKQNNITNPHLTNKDAIYLIKLRINVKDVDGYINKPILNIQYLYFINEPLYTLNRVHKFSEIIHIDIKQVSTVGLFLW